MPQRDSIAQLIPTATAPPAGRALAAAVELRFTAAAWRNRTRGSNAQMAAHEASRLAAAAAAAAATSSISRDVIAAAACHAWPYDTMRGTRDRR
jgi:hypothetical protein